jgi:hypothetical protein
MARGAAAMTVPPQWALAGLFAVLGLDALWLTYQWTRQEKES